MDDGSFHKVANVIGDTMKLHPHGDVSIGDALVALANKEYFIERQGNFGNIVTGHPAPPPATSSAGSPISPRRPCSARPSPSTAELRRPQLRAGGAPAKLPVVLLLGAEASRSECRPVSSPTTSSSCSRPRSRSSTTSRWSFTPTSRRRHRRRQRVQRRARKIKIRARIDRKDDKTVVIREIPFGTTTESLIASIESAAQKGKVKIGSIDDFTTEKVEIEIGLARGVYADEVIPQLYAHTDCEVSLTCNMVLIKDRRPVEMGVSEVLCFLTDQLRATIRAELELELDQLGPRSTGSTSSACSSSTGCTKRIEEATTEEQVKSEVRKGLKPHLKGSSARSATRTSNGCWRSRSAGSRASTSTRTAATSTPRSRRSKRCAASCAS